MEIQLKKLNRIFKWTILKTEMFYVINVYEHEITLQGRYDSDLVSKLKRKGAVSFITDNGYIQFKKSNIEITLT